MKLRKKPPEKFRKDLRKRWEDEIFPAMLLIHGPPPPKLSPDADIWSAERRSNWQEIMAWEHKVCDYYYKAYMSEFERGRKITQAHQHHFLGEFINFCRGQGRGN